MAVGTGAHDVGDKRDLTKIVNSFSNSAHNLEALYKANKSIRGHAKTEMVIAQEELKSLSKKEIREALSIAGNRIKEVEKEEQEKTNAFDKNVIPKGYLKIADVKNSISDLIKTRELLIELEVRRAVLQGKSESDIISVIDARVSKYNTSMEVMITHLASLIVKELNRTIGKFSQDNYSKEELYEAMRQFEFDAENSVYKDLDEEFKEKLRTQIHEEKLKYPQIMSLSTAEPEDKKIQDEAEERRKKEEEEQKKEEETEEKKEEEEEQKKGEETEEKEEEVTNKRKDSNAKWRSVISIAAGIGLGAGVWFAFGGIGVTALMIGGGLAKRALAKQAAKIIEKQQKGDIPIHDAKNFEPTLKGQFQRFRSYINSPEGLDAVQKLLTASIFSSLGMNILGPLLGLQGGQVITALSAGASNVGGGASSNDAISNSEAAAHSNPSTSAGNLKVGDSAGNLTSGYTDSYAAQAGTGSVSLDQSIINGESSHIGSFLVRNGTESIIVSEPGITAAEAAAKYGTTIDNVIPRIVQNDTGLDQAWSTLSDVAKAQGGKSL